MRVTRKGGVKLDEQTPKKVVIKFNGVNHKAKFDEKKSLNERKPKVNVSSWDEKRSAEKEIAAAKE